MKLTHIILIIIFNNLSSLTPPVTINGELISCKDEHNQTVDWFYLYKLPGKRQIQSSSKNNTNNGKGLEFLYITSNSKTFDWKLSDKLIDDKLSIPGYTISQSMENITKTDRLIIAYNDEPPNNRPNGIKGHTKGLVVADQYTGFWLIHSVPKYPNVTAYSNKYTYPVTARKYGQSFLCITFNYTNIDLIGKQLQFNEPNVYYTTITDELSKQYPNLMNVINQEKITIAPYSNEETLKSAMGVEFKSFAKTKKYGKELYEDLVAPTLNSNLYVESWTHGSGVIQSDCTKKNSVWNISELKIKKINFTFSTTNDHSKWCISDTNITDWICVGDINRAERQKRRGGGTVCQKSPKVYELYRSLIQDFVPCPRKQSYYDRIKQYFSNVFRSKSDRRSEYIKDV